MTNGSGRWVASSMTSEKRAYGKVGAIRNRLWGHELTREGEERMHQGGELRGRAASLCQLMAPTSMGVEWGGEKKG